MSLRVYLAALDTAATAWEETSEDVRGCGKSLADADVTLLGDRVEGAARAFVDTWMTEVKRLRTDAADHGDTLREARLLYAQADSDVVERSQQLMAWTDRNASPTGGA
ncbi:hypothetical protein [Nocardioides currus]|uniref:ESX-1 secretion-associated protein n=1 Tax=Nocardioides currus TaxID=2133958 RepID=A0A2R7YT49_9ACTN|nr:hypothetical protein [Nocardioides currus]PUA79019.1 hypothetical protein C7S10_21330 [Nocardioides currus]